MAEIAGRSGIRFDTLFLDEGFAGLDQPNLDRALDALDTEVDERAARVVLITHIGSVADHIRDVLYIEPDGQGGSKTRWLNEEERYELGADLDLTEVAGAQMIYKNCAAWRGLTWRPMSKSVVDQYYDEINLAEELRKAGKTRLALDAALRNVARVPDLVRETTREYGRFDLGSIPPIEDGCSLAAILGDERALNTIASVVEAHKALEPFQ